MPASKNYRRPSFTLMELLVVIAVIGVLAGLAIYFVPSFNTSAKSARGAADLQQLLSATRIRAIRDQAPRGIRILFDPATGLASKCVYLEQPDDLGGGRYYDSGSSSWKTLSVYSDTTFDAMNPNKYLKVVGADFNDGSVAANDYVELNGAGLVHHIQSVPKKDTLKLTFDLTPTIPATTPVKNFRIIRKPRVAGDETFDMPRTIVVDGNTNVAYASMAGTSSFIEQLPTDAAGNLDIMFAPNGTVMPGNTSKAKIYLWVRSTEYTGTFDGEPTLIVVYINSGLVAAYPVNVGNAANPYDLAP